MKELKLKAAKHELCENLGYDEGKMYYLLLIKDEKEIDREYSYSKKYRLFRSLFEQGAMVKIKYIEQDFFSYLLTPPNFMHKFKIEKELINILETLYIRNYLKIFNSTFFQIILKDEQPIIIFLLENFMKKEARIITDNLELQEGLIKSINLKCKKETKRKIGIIDNNLVFEFSNIICYNGHEHVGAISSKENREYFLSIEKELGTIY